MARRRRLSLPVIVLVGGLVVIAAAAVGTLLLTSGNGGNGGGGSNVNTPVKEPTPRSSSGLVGGPEPTVSLPASKYAPLLEEMPPEMQVNVSETFTMNITTFTASYWFDTNAQGEGLAQQWRIIDGYQVEFDPVGLAAQVVQGGYSAWVEVYLFETPAGARTAYEYYTNRLAARRGSEKAEARPLANQSAAFRYAGPTIGTSDVPSVYHRFVFRRGNAVVSIQTYGAVPFMSTDQARELAVLVDAKLLGEAPAVEPTPIPTPAIGVIGG
jgi:hypothetical protein